MLDYSFLAESKKEKYQPAEWVCVRNRTMNRWSVFLVKMPTVFFWHSRRADAFLPHRRCKNPVRRLYLWRYGCIWSPPPKERYHRKEKVQSGLKCDALHRSVWWTDMPCYRCKTAMMLKLSSTTLGMHLLLLLLMSTGTFLSVCSRRVPIVCRVSSKSYQHR